MHCDKGTAGGQYSTGDNVSRTHAHQQALYAFLHKQVLLTLLNQSLVQVGRYGQFWMSSDSVH